MSETFWIALVGITGTAVVAIINAWLHSRTTKLQLSATGDEHREQLNHQRDEARRGRIIEVRKSYLMPLRELLHSIWATQSSYHAAADQLSFSPEQTMSTEIWENFLKWQTSMIDLTKQVVSYTAQLSDSTLNNSINVYFEEESDRAAQLAPLVRDSQSLVGDELASNTRQLKEMLEKSRKARETQLLQINQRIEKLLAGEPTA